MVAQSTGVIRVVSPRVYRVTSVMGEPSETSVCFWFVSLNDSKDWESGWRCSWRCASLSAAHGGCRNVRTVTPSLQPVQPPHALQPIFLACRSE
jgi:hypothetical protein